MTLIIQTCLDCYASR